MNISITGAQFGARTAPSQSQQYVTGNVAVKPKRTREDRRLERLQAAKQRKETRREDAALKRLNPGPEVRARVLQEQVEQLLAFHDRIGRPIKGRKLEPNEVAQQRATFQSFFTHLKTTVPHKELAAAIAVQRKPGEYFLPMLQNRLPLNLHAEHLQNLDAAMRKYTNRVGTKAIEYQKNNYGNPMAKLFQVEDARPYVGKYASFMPGLLQGFEESLKTAAPSKNMFRIKAGIKAIKEDMTFQINSMKTWEDYELAKILAV